MNPSSSIPSAAAIPSAASAPSPAAIPWYRTPIDPGTLKELHRRSDWLGLLQAGGYLGILVVTGTAAYLSAGRLPVAVVVLIFLAHGICCSFLPAAVHEMTHGTVFQSKALNAIFVRIYSFLSWSNFELFSASHARHHRYTLHAPDDLEVVLPMKMIARHLFLNGLASPFGGPFGRGACSTINSTVRIARGKYAGPWELKLFPPDEPEKGRPAVRWARWMLAGHALILAGAIYFKLWLLPLVVTFAPFYGGGLLILLNNAQHIGLQDDVPDFRLCCRTVILNPLLRFLYWHMNYHTEHHMYAAVPCYRLGRLHALIRHDLPPCPRGLIATWKEIAAILRVQKKNPGYQHVAPLPPSSAVRPA